MATVLADVATLAADAGFRSRVAAGIAYKANFISTETLAMESPTAIDKKRLDLAREILLGAGESNYTATFAWALAADQTVEDTSVSDGTILSAIDAYWNVVAGVTV